MHVASLIRASGATALLMIWSFSLAAVSGCKNAVALERSCAAACEEANPKGVQYFNNVASVCACSGCSAACKQSVCYDKHTPSDECLPCVQGALGGAACHEHGGLLGPGCLEYPECKALVDCLVACPGK